MDKPLDSSDKKGLFATKSITDYQEEAAGRHLVRALGIPALIAFGIGGKDLAQKFLEDRFAHTRQSPESGDELSPL